MKLKKFSMFKERCSPYNNRQRIQEKETHRSYDAIVLFNANVITNLHRHWLLKGTVAKLQTRPVVEGRRRRSFLSYFSAIFVSV